jgi:hypothetical protein
MKPEVNGPANIVMMIDALISQVDRLSENQIIEKLYVIQNQAYNTIEYMRKLENISGVKWSEIVHK